MHITKRTLLSGLAGLGLAGCTGSGAAALTPAQIVADITGIVTSLKTAVAGIIVAAPTLIPPADLSIINASISQAETLLGSVTTSLEASASAPLVNQIVGAVTTALTSLSGLAIIPSPYAPILAAIAVVLPIVQAFVASYIPTAPAPKAAAAPGEVAKARAILRIPVQP